MNPGTGKYVEQSALAESELIQSFASLNKSSMSNSLDAKEMQDVVTALPGGSVQSGRRFITKSSISSGFVTPGPSLPILNYCLFLCYLKFQNK